MTNPCVSDLNFDQSTTELRYGRPFATVVVDATQNAVGDGTFTQGNGVSTTVINQSVTYTNTTGTDQLVTPLFFRPNRALYATQPQVPYYHEYWGMTAGAPPGAPALTLQTQFGGGANQSIGGAWYMSEATATYAPFGQIALTNGQGIRIDYQCRLVTTGTGSNGRFGYARNHRIVILADINRDLTLGP